MKNLGDTGIFFIFAPKVQTKNPGKDRLDLNI